jgi:hypothetical protein
MWRLLQVILLVSDVALFALLAYGVATDHSMLLKQALFFLAVLTFLALNFLYVLKVPSVLQRKPIRETRGSITPR